VSPQRWALMNCGCFCCMRRLWEFRYSRSAELRAS
jgi:hypothetical protein